MKENSNIKVMVAGDEHTCYATEINDTIQRASEERGTGIARRTVSFISVA
ncbi:MAG TPA: hypothetical protein PLF35_12770 [Prolixibacteraceae bacterium]|nr:hypothetical protein [Prolixibacteraceae bacterium]